MRRKQLVSWVTLGAVGLCLSCAGEDDPECEPESGCAARLDAEALLPIATGSRGAVRLSVWDGSLASYEIDPLDFTSSDEAVVRLARADARDVRLGVADIWANGVAAGEAVVNVSAIHEAQELSASLAVTVVDPVELQTDHGCSTDLFAPSPHHQFRYAVFGSQGQQLHGDISASLLVEQATNAAVQRDPTVGTGSDGLSFVPAIGTTTLRWTEVGFQKELQFLAPGEIDEILIEQVMFGDRGPGEFGVADLYLKLHRGGARVCAQRGASVGYRVVDGTSCEAAETPGGNPLHWRVVNRGTMPCTVEFSLAGSPAAVELVVP